MADQFITYQGKQYSANQAYEYAKDKGYAKSFAEFVKEYGTPEGKTKLEKILEKSTGVVDTIKDLFGNLGNTGNSPVNIDDPKSPTPADGNSTRILGMKKPVAIGLGLIAASLIIYGIVTVVKNANK